MLLLPLSLVVSLLPLTLVVPVAAAAGVGRQGGAPPPAPFSGVFVVTAGGPPNKIIMVCRRQRHSYNVAVAP
ncbi:hypothetical protein GPECTOR_59g664 [Gonium pectorale]|uniref:Secreted peptide n=1 Tax=Gonium pectorale TaxID=33097 RepID=A0A150G6A0_GONPE|nr:hypothetical protein GPECTOR_59g664 [Gonium pectorale]|eukprot:KXZ45055.1 hypothetical protein GPECTOR_59g664 [Gonium pectorale]